MITIARRALLVAVLLSLLAAPAAHASTLYTTLPGDPISGVNSDFASTTRSIAQSFVPTASGSLGSISFFAQADFQKTAVVSMSIHADSSGQPAASALATGFGNVIDETGIAPTCVIPNATPALAAGTKYWAVFKGVDNNANWLYSRPAVIGSMFKEGAGPWTTFAGAKTFSLRVEDGPCAGDIVPNPDPGASVGDFQLRPGTTSFSTATVSNAGTAPLSITGAGFSGAGASPFKLLQGEPSGPMAIPFTFPKVLGAGSENVLIMYLVCAPASNAADGLYSATFSVNSNDPDEGTINWPATCLVDGTPPIVVITPPPATTGENGWFVNKPSVYIGSADTGVGVHRIYCRDSAGPTMSLLAQQGDLTIAGDGDHHLDCGATDKLGNETPAGTYLLRLPVDTLPPSASAVSGPGTYTNQTAPKFTWSSTDGTSGIWQVECSIDSGFFTACASPATPTLTDGMHTFEVRVRDFAGHYSAAPVKWQSLVDTVPPNTSIEDGPPAATTETTAYVVANISDPPGGSGISGIQCSIDGSDWALCPPMATYENLAEGHHVAAARAKDRAGNVDPTPAQHAWTIDLTAPTATFLTTPRKLTSLETASFTLGATDAGAAPNASFKCKLDDAADFTPCTSPVSFDDLATEADHKLSVMAIDTLGNVQDPPTTFTWTITNTPRAVADQLQAVADTPVDLDVLGNDLNPADGALTPVLATGATARGGTISVAGSKVHYVPPAGFTGTDSFAYKVANAAAMSSAATVTIAVEPKPIVPQELDPPLPDRLAPVISGASASKRRLTFALSEAAAVTVVVKEVVKGRRKPVTRGKLARTGHAGVNVVRIARRLLKRGHRYRLVIRAVDLTGNASGRVTVKLKIR